MPAVSPSRIRSLTRTAFRELWNQQKRARRRIWQHLHLDRSAPRRPFFVVGCHRSGTNMVMWTIEHSPEVWVYHEHRLSPAFRRYRLRSTGILEGLIRRSPAPVVVFKPVCDAHLTDRLLERHAGARAIWIYRQYRDVANSAARNFGDHQRDVLRWIVEGDTDWLGWRGERLSPEFVRLVQEVYRPDMPREEASALMWYSRTGLFLELGLDQDERVLLVRYEDLVSGAVEPFRRLFAFLGIRFDPGFLEHVFPSSIGKDRFPAIDGRVEARCEELQRRMDETYQRKLAGAAPPAPAQEASAVNRR